MSKYFWEVGTLLDDSSNIEYISLVVNLFDTVALVFFIVFFGLVQHDLFQHFFCYHLFFFSKLVGLRESIASIENYIFGRKVSKINLRIIYDYKLLKPKILRQNAQ